MILFEKNLKISSGSNLIFRVLTFDLLSVQFISFVKRKANSTTKEQKCKGHKKRDRILFSKVDFNFQIFQRNKKITY